MLSVHKRISSVEAEVRNGSNQSRYHGNTTGAHKSEAAIGQANISGDDCSFVLLSNTDVTKPTSTVNPANN